MVAGELGRDGIPEFPNMFAVTKLHSTPIGKKKNSGLYGIWAHNLCDTGAVLYQLS